MKAAGKMSATTTKGYLIALMKEGNTIRVYGSPADRTDCDEILEINGKSFGDNVQHAEIVRHIHECIELRNICLRVRRATNLSTTSGDDPSSSSSSSSSLLDVFVIGANAHEQLNRFFKITNTLASPQDLLKLTDKMEMLELNNTSANLAANSRVTSNGAHSTSSHQHQQDQQQQQQQQLSNMTPPHLYRNHRQPEQQHQQSQMMRPHVNDPEMISKHNELPPIDHHHHPDQHSSFVVGAAKQALGAPPNSPPRSMPLNNITANLNLNEPHSPMQPLHHHHGHNHPNHQPITNSCAKQTPAAANGHLPLTHQSSSCSASVKKLKLLEKNGCDHQRALEAGQSAARQSVANNNQAFERQSLSSASNVCSTYQRLESNLNGEFAGISSEARLAKLLSIYETILQISTHNKQQVHPTTTTTTSSSSSSRPSISRVQQQHSAEACDEPIITSSSNVCDLLQSVIYLLNRDEEMTDEGAELFAILRKHEMVDGVCSAFDRIAQTYEPRATLAAAKSLPPEPMVPESEHALSGAAAADQSQNQKRNNGFQVMVATSEAAEDGQQQTTTNSTTIRRVVRIEKTSNQALGATIKNDIDGSVIVGRVVCGGAAQRSGLLHEGDEILEVNGVQMRGKNVNEVVNLLEAMDGTLTFTIVARRRENNSDNYAAADDNNKLASTANHKPPTQQQFDRLFVRAFFKYDAQNDDFIPCKELGLSFDTGEILAIIDQTDPQWWQAHRDGDSEWRLAGLVPSISLLKQREKDTNTHCEAADISTGSATSAAAAAASVAYLKQEKKAANLVSMLFNCPKGNSPARRSRKRPPLPQNSSSSSSIQLPAFGPEEIPYYEQVCLYHPDKHRKRPIILVGPKMIGQREIAAKLLQHGSGDRFASPVSHTSRPMQTHERNGVDFHFVTRSQFESDIKAGKFVECGQYQNQYYGTSLDAIKTVVNSGKTCVHLVNTPSIFQFRQGRAGVELKPFFVFVRPDDRVSRNPEKLRELVGKFSTQSKTSAANTDENIRAILAETQLIDAHYLPFFDLVLGVGTDVERAYQELLLEIGKIESEPQWIPMFWSAATGDYNDDRIS